MRISLAVAIGLLAGIASADPGVDLASARERERMRVDLIERLAPAVGAVFRSTGAGGGSGVIISPDGYALTNHHVTGKAKEMRVGLPGGRLLLAMVIGVDPMGDIALLRVLDEKPLPWVELGNSDDLRVGDWAIAMGNPFLLATDFQPTVTLGIVSGVHRYQPGRGANRLVYPDCIQVDTPINPGNSGGPLFDGAGRLVGINGRISVGPRGRNNVGVGFAVGINQIRNFLPDLRAGKWVDHGTLDATVRDDVGPDGKTRTIFDQMYEDSVAAVAGIRLGDELVSFDGRRVVGANDFLNRITVLPARWEVEVVVRRQREGAESEEHTFRVRLAAIPTAPETERKKHEPDVKHVRWETTRLLRRCLNRWGATKVERYAGKGIAIEREGRTLTRRRERFVESVHEDGSSMYEGSTPEEEDHVLPEARVGRLRRDAALLAVLASGDTAALGVSRLLGGNRIDGRVVDVVEAEYAGLKAWFYFDAETGDCLRVEEREEGVGGSVTWRFDDHRKVDGGVRPFRIRVFLGRRKVRDEKIESWKLGGEGEK